MNFYLIGLTGNIACGKSTVLALLQAHGAEVIDADRVTHELQAPGQPVYQQIVAAFGPGILAEPGGVIDRRKLGAIVFNDPAQLRVLEGIVHPAVHQHIKHWLAGVGAAGETGDRRQETADSRQQTADRRQQTADSRQQTADSRQQAKVAATAGSDSLAAGRLPTPVAVIDAIKLLEAGWKPWCNAIWVVTCTREQQLARLIATRGMSAAEAMARIDAQPPQAEKVAQATVVIDNSGTLDQTRQQVEAAWAAIMASMQSAE